MAKEGVEVVVKLAKEVVNSVEEAAPTWKLLI